MLTLYPKPESFIGHEFDGYVIDDVLGNGGMGIVFKATQIDLSREVALKVINPSLAREESFARRFKAEARALAKIHHPNIVVLYNFRPFEHGFYIAMEYVEGATLADYLSRKGKLNTAEVIRLGKQILSALHCTHSSGIVHRDIKPSNILIKENQTVKITDFGLAKIAKEGVGQHDTTQTMHTGGTLCYMPPEQIRGLQNVDHRGDLFSVGMTMYEALAGRLPFNKNASGYLIQKRIVEETFPDIRTFEPSITKSMQRIIMKAIEKEPHKRFQSAMEMISALEDSAPISQPRYIPVTSSSIPKQVTDTISTEPITKKPFAFPIALGLVGLLILITFNIDIFSRFLPSAFSPPPQTLAEQLAQHTLSEPASPLNDTDVAFQPSSTENKDTENKGTEGSGTENKGTEGSKGPSVAPVVSSQVDLEPEAPTRPPTVSVTTSTQRESARAVGSIRVDTSPTGVEIWIADSLAGTSPLLLDKVRAGELTIELRKDDYEPLSLAETISPLEITFVNALLQPVQGTLKLDVTSASKIYINNRLVDTGSLPIIPGDQAFDPEEKMSIIDIPLPATNHMLEVVHPSYGKWKGTVDITSNDTAYQRIDFTQKIKVAVTAFDEEDKGVYAEIFIGDTSTGMYTPAQIDLFPGFHDISVKAEGYQLATPNTPANYSATPSEPIRFILERTLPDN